MRRILILFLISLNSLVGLGQMNIETQKGYIINSENDTIFGEIFAYPADYLSNKVKFIDPNTGEKMEYTPTDLKGFHIDKNKDFIVISIKERTRKDTTITKYFAQKAIKGEVEFIVLSLNNKKERYFIKSNDFGITELSQIVTVENGVKSTSNKYKFELGKYFFRYPEFQKNINKTKFHYKSLNNLIANYNAKFDESSSGIKESKSNWHLKANIGMDYYLGENIENDNNAKGIVFGLKNSFYNKDKNLKTEFVVGVSYRYYSYNYPMKVKFIADTLSIIEFPIGPTRYTFEYSEETLNYSFSASIIEIPIYIEYNNKLKLISPILQLGFKPFLIQEKVKLQNNGTIRASDWKLGWDFILGMGVGINYNRLSLKCIVNAEPLLMTSFGIDYRLN